MQSNDKKMGADLSNLFRDNVLTSRRYPVQVLVDLSHFGGSWDGSLSSICWVVWRYNCSSRTLQAAATAGLVTLSLSFYLHS